MKRVKLCDFGSASYLPDCEITPYLVSRFYRAPEISTYLRLIAAVWPRPHRSWFCCAVLGLKYGEPIDMWSVGCVLFELYTGKILFQGGDNNEMLYLIQEVKGRFPNKLLKKAKFANMHYDVDYVFERRKIDKITNQVIPSMFLVAAAGAAAA